MRDQVMSYFALVSLRSTVCHKWTQQPRIALQSGSDVAVTLPNQDIQFITPT